MMAMPSDESHSPGGPTKALNLNVCRLKIEKLWVLPAISYSYILICCFQKNFPRHVHCSPIRVEAAT